MVYVIDKCDVWLSRVFLPFLSFRIHELEALLGNMENSFAINANKQKFEKTAWYADSISHSQKQIVHKFLQLKILLILRPPYANIFTFRYFYGNAGFIWTITK